MLSAPCRTCGSTKSKQVTVTREGEVRFYCASQKGCIARRCQRRLEEDRKRGGRQCMAATGVTSIRFCLLREGHEGLHLSGVTEWGKSVGGLGKKVSEALRSRENDGEVQATAGEERT